VYQAGGAVVWQAASAVAAGPLKDITDRYVGSAVAASYLSGEAGYRAVRTREFDTGLNPKPAYTRINP
jgi:endo-1,4-beta-xylanase